MLLQPPVIAAALAGLSSVVLAIAGFALGRPGWIRGSFGLGMVLFGAESLAIAMLLAGEGVLGARVWLGLRLGAELFAPLAWAVFATSITRNHAAPLPPLWKAGLGAGTAAGAVLLASVLMLDGILSAPDPAPFEYALLTGPGIAAAAYQLLLAIVVLTALEACLRQSRGDFRHRVKYLVLGLGGIYLAQFYLLSQITLFRAITASDLGIRAATLLVGNAVIGVSLIRTRLPESQLTVSRGLVYRSVVIGVLGAYLLAVGGVGWLLRLLEIPEQAFWVTLLVFISTLGVGALLLSDGARWRLKRFIALNFYRSKYDYREQWIAFTRRLDRLVALEDLGPELLDAVTEAVGSTAAVLYLRETSSSRYHLAASMGVRRAPPLAPVTSPVLAKLATSPEPLVLDTGLDWDGGELREVLAEGSVAVPLGSRGTLTGFFVVGPERSGSPYTAEDLEFMATMGQQATGSIVTARLSEDLARAREFDAFARVASFVIHDLKNLISSLSLLSQNAVKYFDDPEFQRDTVRTLARTVERMQAMLERLSMPSERVVVRSDPVDLPGVAREAIEAVAFPDRVKLETHFEPVPAVAGDPDALLRVLQNLLTNAGQAIAGEGTVSVTVRRREGNAILSVADTGCGMSEEFIRESLFVPFRTTKRGGWGIGLYQVKEIVERHGGAITVSSTPGAGTTFEVSIPVLAPEPVETV